MATRLSRPVRRSTPPPTPRDPGHVVTLYPATASAPAIIEIREHRRRKSYSIAVGTLYTMLAIRDASRGRPRRSARRGVSLR